MVLAEPGVAGEGTSADLPAPAGPKESWRRVLLVASPILLPLLGVLLVLGRERWFPTGDLAQAELHLRGFWRHPPLVGAAGRIGDISIPYGQGSHPGPSMWVAMLPVYTLLGRSSLGLMAAMVSLHAAAIVGSLVVARRIGGEALAVIVAIACALIVRASGSQFLVEPWNPWGGVLPYLCFLLLVVAVARGDTKLLPWAVVVGSHCIQCHVGYLPLVGAPLGVVTLLRVRVDGRKVLRPLAWAVGLGVALWLPPVVDQLRREPGNLRILWDHFTTPDAPAVGLGAAVKAFIGEFNVAGGWLWGPNRLPTDPPNYPGFVAMVVLVGAGAVVAWRRRDREVLTLMAVVAGACVVGIVAMSRIFGEFYDYVVRWLWILTVLALAATAWSFVRAAGERRMSGRSLRIGALTFVSIASVVAAFQFAGDELPAVRNSRLIGVVAAQAVPELDSDGRYLVRWHDPASLGAVGFGAVLELERQGFTVGVDAFASAGALPHRVMPEETATGVLWVVTGEKAIDAFRARTDATELGFYDQRTRAEQTAAFAMRQEMEDRLTELGLAELIPALDTQYGLAPFVIGDAPVPQDFKNLAAAYNELRLPLAMFLVPPGAPLYIP